jgi:hypothetical protein
MRASSFPLRLLYYIFTIIQRARGSKLVMIKISEFSSANRGKNFSPDVVVRQWKNCSCSSAERIIRRAKRKRDGKKVGDSCLAAEGLN